MKRREFITLVGGWPLAGRAQQRERVREIGFVKALRHPTISKYPSTLCCCLRPIIDDIIDRVDAARQIVDYRRSRLALIP